MPRLLLLVGAVLFAAANILYSVLWMYYIRRPPRAEIGIGAKYSIVSQSIVITRLAEGGSAERAGLQVGDGIVAINDAHLGKVTPYFDFVERGQSGETVRLTVLRPGAARAKEVRVLLEKPWPLPLLLGSTLPSRLTPEIMGLYPLPFLVVGLAVLFLRLRDQSAWLLALLFGGFIGVAQTFAGSVHPALRGFANSYHVILGGAQPALFYYFFASFPAPSPLERRAPWLKWVFAVGGAATLTVGLWTVVVAGSYGPAWLPIERSKEVILTTLLSALAAVYSFGAQGLGITSLVFNSIRAETAEARRKARVIVRGVVGGLSPIFLLVAILTSTGGWFDKVPFWIWAVSVLGLFLIPLSFAYAVVKHRVMEIPALLKRSARYVLVQRGFVFLSFALSVTAVLLFISVFTRLSQSHAAKALPAGLGFGVAFGVVSALGGRQLHQRVSRRIDRPFFRSAYDAQTVLQELAEQARTASDRQQLAALLERQITMALHPQSLAIYFETSPGLLAHQHENVAPGLATIPASVPELAELPRHAQPWDFPPLTGEGGGLSMLALLQPECLVPMLGRDGRLIGLLVLGLRLSEEPYSREDKNLLASAASRAAIALESIRLAEQMAGRIEAERRAALEMGIAKQVQAKLFPQRVPPLETLEYFGGCVQAREVGGDYYDFLELAPGRVAFVLADVAGKGISAALLMANLQANLRSQYARALKDVPGLPQSVNRLFCDSTPPSHFATLFFGDYEDSTRRLRYASCGHCPPILLRRNGTVERLPSTATVLGLFDDWECLLADAQLASGDTLVLFSDGVTEARSDEDKEFGEARLIETLLAQRHLPIPELLEGIMTTVQRFSGREHEDDLTLVVARAK